MFSALSRFLLTAALVVTGVVARGDTGAAAPAAVPDPGGWDPPVTLGTSPGTYPSFDVAVAPDGSMTMALVEDGDLLLAQRPPGGGWGAPTTLVNNGTVNAVQAAYDDAGLLVVAWADSPDRTRLVSRHQLAGGAWTTDEVVATRATDEFWQLDLEVNGRGDVALGAVWLGPESAPVIVSQRLADGDWATPARFVAVRFDVALGEVGPVARTWTTWTDEVSTVRVARRPIGAGTWGPTTRLARLTGATLPLGTTSATVDPTGTTTVAWRDRSEAGGWQLRASRARKGQPFGPEVVVAAHAGVFDLAYSPPQVLSSDAGDTLVLWMRTDGTLEAARRPAHGRWSQPVTVKPRTGVMPWAAALDPGGRAVAVWIRGGWFGEPGHGVVASLMTRNGVWSVPANLTRRAEQVLEPVAAMRHGDALAGWIRAVDTGHRYRAGTHLRP